MKLANFPPVLRILLLAVLLSVMTACRQAALPHKTFLVMGTFFTVTLPADYADYLEPAGVLSANALYGLENQLSLFNSESDIGRLNRAAGGAPIPVSEETIAILRAAHRYGEISGGAFDITIPPLMKVWGLRGGPAPEHTPSPAALTEALQHVDFRRVEIGDQTARLASPGMQADLGGIAKGFAVDEVARIMLKNGLTNILINLGGNIRAQGYATPSAPWHVAIQNPFAEERVLGKLALREGEAVATSGNYERFVTIGGRRYAHILDPRTGRPVEGMASVTIITTGPDAAMDADALSTTLFVMGYEQGAGFLATNFPDFAVLFVPARQPLELYATPAFATRFTPAPEYANRVRLLP